MVQFYGEVFFVIDRGRCVWIYICFSNANIKVMVCLHELIQLQMYEFIFEACGGEDDGLSQGAYFVEFIFGWVFDMVYIEVVAFIKVVVNVYVQEESDTEGDQADDGIGGIHDGTREHQGMSIRGLKVMRRG